MHSKSEIRNLCHPVLQKYVGSLNVTVNNTLGIQVVQTLVNVTNIWPSLKLSQSALQAYLLSQRPSLTQLRKAITFLAGFKHIITLNDIGMI